MVSETWSADDRAKGPDAARSSIAAIGGAGGRAAADHRQRQSDAQRAVRHAGALCAGRLAACARTRCGRSSRSRWSCTVRSEERVALARRRHRGTEPNQDARSPCTLAFKDHSIQRVRAVGCFASVASIVVSAHPVALRPAPPLRSAACSRSACRPGRPGTRGDDTFVGESCTCTFASCQYRCTTGFVAQQLERRGVLLSWFQFLVPCRRLSRVHQRPRCRSCRRRPGCVLVRLAGRGASRLRHDADDDVGAVLKTVKCQQSPKTSGPTVGFRGAVVRRRSAGIP